MLTVDKLRDAIKDLPGDMPVTFLNARAGHYVVDTAFHLEVIERDTNSHAPKTGCRIETREHVLKGGNEKVLALSGF